MRLSATARVLKTVGIKTHEIKAFEQQELQNARNKERQNIYLTQSRKEAIKKFPELSDIFAIEDDALLFYQNVLGSYQKSLNTNQRNMQRAKDIGLQALASLDEGLDIPAFSSAGMAQEVEAIKTDELKQLRASFELTWSKSAELSHDMYFEYCKKYSIYSTNFSKGEKEAIEQFPELEQLKKIKKLALKYYSQWVRPEFLDDAIKACVNRAITHISKGLPIENTLEIKEHAKSLNNTTIGLGVSSPRRKKNKNEFVYNAASLMRQLIGRNGIKTGLWPYNLDAQKEAELIESIDFTLKQEKIKTAFVGLPRSEALTLFPELEPLYNKYDASYGYFSQKTVSGIAKRASYLLIADDFYKIAKGETLLAVSEIDKNDMNFILARAQSVEKMVRGSDVFLSANDEIESFKSISSNKEVGDIEETKILEKLQEDSINGPQTVHTKEGHKGEISLDKLHSTAAAINLSKMFPVDLIINKKDVSAGKIWDIKEIESGLNERVEELAIKVLGEPLKRDNNQLRYGTNKGSLIITTDGTDKGKWYDHQSGVGGNLLNLIQNYKEVGFKEALDYAGEFLDLKPDTFTKHKIDTSDIESSFSQDKIKKIAYARELVAKSTPIAGTLGEIYLTKERGISLENYSQSVRFLPKIKEPETGQICSAVLLSGYTINGSIQGVQLIYLDKNGKKLNCETPKRSYGVIKGTATPVQHGGNIIAVAEGPETALSIANAKPELTVFAALGSITNISAIEFCPKGNTIIVCADNDKNNIDTANKTNKACEEFKNQGFNVIVAKPSKAGYDFNDILREHGVGGINKELNRLYSYGAKEAQITIQKSQAIGQEKTKQKKFDRDLGYTI